jgi:predicted O-methyltransferase YrrM
MASTLRSPRVAGVLGRLLEQVALQDPPAKRRVRDREIQLGRRLSQVQRYELYGEAPLAITRDVGELLYVLTVARRAHSIVEFGCSLGLSTIFLAAGLRDNDCAGSLVTTELLPRKARTALENLEEAGLDDLIELRVGDALQTLVNLTEPVDLLFLDGRNDLYLPVLRLLEPCLASDALVAADLNVDDPDLLPYLEHVRDRTLGYFSINLPLDAGVEVSVRVA